MMESYLELLDDKSYELQLPGCPWVGYKTTDMRDQFEIFHHYILTFVY